MGEYSLVWQHKSFLLTGAVYTIEIAVLATFLGLSLGAVFGMARISQNIILRTVADVYVQVLRGTPMLLQIYFVFFGIPQIYYTLTGNGLLFEPIVAGVLALGLNSGAYVTEIVRSGIQSIDKGQMEAARSLGLTWWQAMKLVILPQAFRRIIPPLVNEFIVLLKDSSLVSAIGAGELMYSAKVMGARYYNWVEFLIGAAVIYLFLTFIISRLAALLERRLAISD